MSERDKEDIKTIFRLLEEKNSDIISLKESNIGLQKDVENIKSGVERIELMILNDQVGRNEKREKVIANGKDIELLKKSDERQNKWNLTCIFVVMAASIKLAFFSN